MSGLILPPGYQHTPESDAAALRQANAQAATRVDFEPYYSELPKIKAAGDKLNRIFAFTGEEAWTERQFETTASNLFGDIGLEIAIEWLQAMDPETGEELPFKAPSLTITGRVKKETERDHDKIRHEIVSGLGPDGQKGYIREDGTKHEEPIRKVIT